MKTNKVCTFLERMERGKDYEKSVGEELKRLGLDFKTQVRYNTTQGNYLADFVYSDIIIESTDSDLNKSRGIAFIDRKIKKLRELSEVHQVIIVTTSPKSWKEEVPNANCITIDELNLI